MATLIELSTFTVLSLDVTTTEEHNHAVEWTSFPVENDIAVSDHGHLQPDEVSIEGVITDTPLLGVPEQDRSKVLWDKLVELKDLRKPMTLVTGLKVYSSMVIAELATARDASSGKAVMPRLKLQQIKIVAPIEVPAPEVAAGLEKKVELTDQERAELSAIAEEASAEVDYANAYLLDIQEQQLNYQDNLANQQSIALGGA